MCSTLFFLSVFLLITTGLSYYMVSRAVCVCVSCENCDCGSRCGHCKRLWEQLGGHYRENDQVEIVKVDCTVQKKTCQRYQVRGYPTLILIADSKYSLSWQQSCYLCLLSGRVLEKYSGRRTFDDLQQFVEDSRIYN